MQACWSDGRTGGNAEAAVWRGVWHALRVFRLERARSPKDFTSLHGYHARSP